MSDNTMNPGFLFKFRNPGFNLSKGCTSAVRSQLFARSRVIALNIGANHLIASPIPGSICTKILLAKHYGSSWKTAIGDSF